MGSDNFVALLLFVSLILFWLKAKKLMRKTAMEILEDEHR